MCVVRIQYLGKHDAGCVVPRSLPVARVLRISRGGMAHHDECVKPPSRLQRAGEKRLPAVRGFTLWVFFFWGGGRRCASLCVCNKSTICDG